MTTRPTARELRDRWLERVNGGGAGEYAFEEAGKYDVSRALQEGPGDAGQADAAAAGGVTRAR